MRVPREEHPGEHHFVGDIRMAGPTTNFLCFLAE